MGHFSELIEKLKESIPAINYPEGNFVIEPCEDQGPGFYKVQGVTTIFDGIPTQFLTCDEVQLMLEVAEALGGGAEA